MQAKKVLNVQLDVGSHAVRLPTVFAHASPYEVAPVAAHTRPIRLSPRRRLLSRKYRGGGGFVHCTVVVLLLCEGIDLRGISDDHSRGPQSPPFKPSPRPASLVHLRKNL